MQTGASTYFDSCVFLSMFILMGRVLESRARVKVSNVFGGHKEQGADQ
jgi:cation transport ATPase